MEKLMSNEIKSIIEAAIMAAHKPLTIQQIINLFDESARPEPTEVRNALEELKRHYQGGVVLVEVASGYRFQINKEIMPKITKLWQEKPPKYSRALLETLALIAYRQPITRAEIEEIRGVTVSTYLMKTLQERGWIKAIGHRDLPGKPALYGTTKLFLDYFNLKTLAELPLLETHFEIES